ncbi:MAG: glycosyltransferase family 9 protein [Phycisphaerae bacterium]|nr:glycosyltransferase family 9 protein [Phycisphaerae bacterium]
MSSRAVVFHAGALGDCVLALHVVREILPRHATHWVARSPVAKLAIGRSRVATVTDLDGPGLHTLFIENGPLAPEVAGVLAGADVVVSFIGGPDSVVARRLGAATRSRVLAVDPKVRPETIAAPRHITTQWLADLDRPPLREAAGRVPLLALDCQAVEAGARRWGPPTSGTRGRVLLHPGSGGKAKCWPLERFEALARALRGNGWQVAWLIGPVEHDWFGDGLTRRLEATAPVFAGLELPEAAGLIATADVFVGNDSGTSHLAASLARPSVVLFGPTSPQLWRPLGPSVHVLAGGGGGDPFAGFTVSDARETVARAARSHQTPSESHQAAER